MPRIGQDTQHDWHEEKRNTMNTKYFGYPAFDETGTKILTTMDGLYKETLMNVTCYNMKAGEERVFFLADEELAILLLRGRLSFTWAERTEVATRQDFFREKPYCLHVCNGTRVLVKALEAAEILVQSTTNERPFAPVFYQPQDCLEVEAGRGLCDNTAVRIVRTLFDYENAPYSNMVLGEIVGSQGGWSGYIPHAHVQPEVYYYRFDKPQGFGACFIGDEVYKIKDGSFSALTNNTTHPQVSAPGYPMYIVWMIRHLDGNPWTSREEDPDHLWMVEEAIQYR